MYRVIKISSTTEDGSVISSYVVFNTVTKQEVRRFDSYVDAMNFVKALP